MSALKKSDGFTLTEVIVAITLLVLISAAIAPMISGAFSTIFRAGHKSQALQEAEEKAHEARTQKTWDEDNPFPEIVFADPDESTPLTIDVSGKEASVRWQWQDGTTSITIYVPAE